MVSFNYIEEDANIIVKTQDILTWLISICILRGQKDHIQRELIKSRIFKNTAVTINNSLLIIAYTLGYYLYYGPEKKRSFNWSYSDIEEMCILLSNIKKDIPVIVIPLKLNVNDFINSNLL